MELKEVLNFLGFKDDIASLEDFKKEFNPTFIRKENAKDDEEIVKTIVGKRLGSLETKIKQLAKKSGIELTGDEIKEKSLEEVTDLVIGKFNTKVTDLQKLLDDASKATNDEKVKTLTTELEKVKGEATDFKAKFENLGTEFETFKTNVSTQGKQAKLDNLKNKAFESIKFKNGISEFEKEGFLSKMEKTYKFELDETGDKLLVTDKEGKTIANPNKAGKVFSPEELLETQAIEGKLYAINPNNTQVNTQVIIGKVEPGKTTNTRPINPAAAGTSHVMAQ